MPVSKKKARSKPRYVKPLITVEKISVSLFRKESLRNELKEFNLLAATDAASDDY